VHITVAASIILVVIIRFIQTFRLTLLTGGKSPGRSRAAAPW
jgi:hypothetical protein